MRKLLIAIAAAAALAVAAPAHAGLSTGHGDGGFVLTEIGSFDTPTYADDAPGTKGALYVVEKAGVVRVWRDGRTLARPFLDISDRVASSGEQGLLSIAFHPGYKRNGLFYVYFTNRNGDLVVMEFRRSRKRFVADRGSARKVLLIPHPGHANHNGGTITFGPDDLLYAGPGDGGGGGDQDRNAQDRGSLLGKLLRIDPRRARRKNGGFRSYTSPKGNPFVEAPGRDEIYAVGLRNPFRFSFDSATGAISLGDVGQDCREEIDYRNRGEARGANFGWSRFEGTNPFNGDVSAPGAIPPIQEYDSSHTSCPPVPGDFDGVSVIAGFVVRDPSLPDQYGRLLYGDASRDQLRSLIPHQAGSSDDQDTGVPIPAGSPFGFAEGFRHRPFVVSGNGPVYRLDPAP